MNEYADFFWKSSTDFGINEQGGQLYLLNLINNVWGEKNSKNF